MSASRMAKAFTHSPSPSSSPSSYVEEESPSSHLESESPFSYMEEQKEPESEFEISGNSSKNGVNRDVDVLVGTPARLLEMALGNGWDRVEEMREEGRTWVVGEREMGLERVEWVVVDEADTLFGTSSRVSCLLRLAGVLFVEMELELGFLVSVSVSVFGLSGLFCGLFADRRS